MTARLPDHRVVIVGGGYVGMHVALHLRKKLLSEGARLTIIDPHARMTYLPFLPEAAAGNIEPRHLVVSLHRTLHGCEVVTGHATHIDSAGKRVTVAPVAGPVRTIPYDTLVVAAGSIVRTMPVPGLSEHAIGLKSLGEAIYLRDHVLTQLDIASSTDNARVRRTALTFVVAGGGFAGVETLAELEDMTRSAMRYMPELDPREMRWVLVEAGDHILPELGPDMGEYTARQLARRGVDIKLKSRIVSLTGGRVTLDDGKVIPAGTIVWTAGIRANPLAGRSDLPVDERGRIVCDATMRVVGVDGVWAAGDIAAVPDLTVDGQWCAPTAQHAVRQAHRLGRNIVLSLRGKEPQPYRHSNAGAVASLGLHKGAARIYGVKIKGLPAWLLHRSYHVSRMPTVDRKLRIWLDWTLAGLFRRDVVALGDLENPRKQFREAAREESPAPARRASAEATPSSNGHLVTANGSRPRKKPQRT